MKRAPCCPHSLWVWDQRDLQCLSLPDGGSWRLRGSQTHIVPRPWGEVLAEDPAMSCSDEPGQGGEAGRPQPRLLLRAVVMGGSPCAPPPPLPPRVSCGPAIRGASWAAAAGACTPLDLDLRL